MTDRADRPRRIDVEYLEGPLKRLNNHWVFEPHESGGTCLHFFVDFEFRSRVLQALIGTLFYEALRRLVAAFEARARKLYGPGIVGAPSAQRTT